MKNTTPQSIVPNLDKWTVGSHERLINGYWELGMMRFHTFTNDCGEDLQNTYNRINNGLGVQTIYIDLLSLAGEDYRNKSQIMDIIRSDKPTWIWFINCEALLNGSLAGYDQSSPHTMQIIFELLLCSIIKSSSAISSSVIPRHYINRLWLSIFRRTNSELYRDVLDLYGDSTHWDKSALVLLL